MSVLDKIFNCGSRKWVHVIGLFQAGLILAGTIVFALYTAFNSLWAPGELSESERQVVAYRFFVLICFLVSLTSTAAIIYNNKKERAGCLGLWIIINSSYVVATAIGVLTTRENPIYISYPVFILCIAGALTYAVLQRIKDINITELQGAMKKWSVA